MHSFEEIPDEVVCIILSFCNIITIDSLQLTCQHFFHLLHEDAELLSTYRDKWTDRFPSYRSWYQLCLNVFEEDTQHRMTQYESTIHPKLFFLHKCYEDLQAKVKQSHGFIERTETDILYKLPVISNPKTSGSRNPEVVLLSTDLLEPYICIVRIQKGLGMQAMTPTTYSWFYLMQKAKKEGTFDRKCANLLSKRNTIIMLYYVHAETLGHTLKILPQLETAVKMEYKCKVVSVRLKKSFTSLQKDDAPYLSMVGLPNRRTIMSNFFCGRFNSVVQF